VRICGGFLPYMAQSDRLRVSDRPSRRALILALFTLLRLLQGEASMNGFRLFRPCFKHCLRLVERPPTGMGLLTVPGFRAAINTWTVPSFRLTMSTSKTQPEKGSKVLVFGAGNFGDSNQCPCCNRVMGDIHRQLSCRSSGRL
jgi:hypothetical protein